MADFDKTHEFYGYVATSNQSGSTAAIKMVQGKKRLASEVEDLIQSDHSVRVFRCVEVEYEVSRQVTITFND